MSYKPPTLTALFLLLICSDLGSQPPATNSTNSSNSSTLRASGNLTKATQQLKNAVSMLQKRKSVDVKIRMQTQLHGHNLFGSGSYHQVEGGAATKFRLEMKLGPANQSSTLLNVCDGQYLWMRKQLPKLKQLQRVNMEKLIKAMKEKNVPLASSANALQFGPAMGIGGLPFMLQSINQHFEFDKIEVRRLKTVEVYVLSGKLKKASLATVLPEQAEAIKAGKEVDLSKLPAHVPLKVVVYLGRNDLFPYKLEYIKKVFKVEGGKKTDEQIDQVYLNIQMYDRKFNTPIEGSKFIYKPGSQEIWDLTENYLLKFGLK